MSGELEQDLICPICRDVFRDPVVLLCSHSFCRRCLSSWWRDKIILECPVCKTASATSDPPSNSPLKQQCTSSRRRRGPGAVCRAHGERLQLFCVEHQQPVCAACRRAAEHDGHRFRAAAEAAEDQRAELRKALGPLQDKLKRFQEEADGLEQTARHLALQAGRAEARIRDTFRKLHHFLNTEEDARVAALRTESSSKTQRLRLQTDVLSRDMAALSQTIRDAEGLLRGEDGALLLRFQSAAPGIRQRLLLEEPRPAAGALIDEARHLGNLGFHVWRRMRPLAPHTPVVLDPNTANAELLLSDDLTELRCGQRRDLPDNPERFDFFRIALGAEGFGAGTHSWDVEVADDADWFVGVASQDVQRKGIHPSGLWRVGRVGGRYVARALAEPSTTLEPAGKPSRVRVQLDRSRGTLLFLDLDSDAVIHSFTHSFTGKLFPYFNTASASPMRLIPDSLSAEPRPPPT